MRRPLLLLTLLALVLSIGVAGSTLAKPAGGNNSANAKDCQKGKYATLATSEDQYTAFATEKACVSYAANGGVIMPLQTVTGRIIIPAGHTATMSGQIWAGQHTLVVSYLTSTGATGPLGTGKYPTPLGPVSIGPFAHPVALTIVVDDQGWSGLYGACGQFTSEGNHALVVATATGYAVAINDGNFNCAAAGGPEVPQITGFGAGDAELTITLAPAV